MNPSMNMQPYFCSWSGGKDSCMSLYRAMQEGSKPEYLLTMLTEDGLRSRSHWLPKVFLEAQARSLGIPIVFRSASWQDYESEFVAALRAFRKEGITAGVFGDIDGESNRAWVHKVCAETDISPLQPLWKEDRQKLLDEFIGLDFKSTIVVLNDKKLGKEFLGKVINAETVAELEQAGVDVCGELGEYHTVVTAGPIFSEELVIQAKRKVHHAGYWFLDIDGS
ncbi:MAG: diphthine--ammonia ligase [Anaerolineaceae bacterium]|nr:diphthine--ammonia ligase [Anaerolineaceae bacterium]